MLKITKIVEQKANSDNSPCGKVSDLKVRRTYL